MAGKPTPKNELIEELMEAVSLYSNFAEDTEKVLERLDKNENEDHLNDKIRNEVISLLLKLLESCSMKNYEQVDRFAHSAVQRLHSQEQTDFKDDSPRTEAKTMLSVIRQKAIDNQKILKQLIEKVSERSGK